MKGFKKLTAAVLGAVMALSVMSFTAFAEESEAITVSQNGSVQEAIDNIADGGVITVEEGTYKGPFKIENKNNVKIVGEGNVKFTFDSNAEFSSVTAVNGESTPYAGILTILGSDNITVENIIINGNIEAASGNTTLTHSARYAGVAVINSNVLIKDCEINDITYEGHLQGMQNGFGIYAVSENAEKLEVVNTDINNFNKSAVITRSEIELYMKGCNIKGFGEQGVISQNGIQYAGDTTITNCSVEDLKYVADNEWTGGSVAIYNTGSDNESTIKDVETKGVDYSISVNNSGKTVVKGGTFDGLLEAGEGGSLIIESGNFVSDVSDYLHKDSNLVKDKNGNYVVMDEEEYKDYKKSEKKSSGSSYSLEEGKVSKKDDEKKEEPVVTPEEKGPFYDVSTSDPNYDAIIKVYEKGWMVGVSDGVFAANGTLTRGMAATILWNKAGKPEPVNVSPFLDVTGDAYYAKAVAWAYEQGIVLGYDGTTFGPNDFVTTEQFTIMLDKSNGSTPAAYVGGAPNATRGWVAGMITK